MVGSCALASSPRTHRIASVLFTRACRCAFLPFAALSSSIDSTSYFVRRTSSLPNHLISVGRSGYTYASDGGFVGTKSAWPISAIVAWRRTGQFCPQLINHFQSFNIVTQTNPTNPAQGASASHIPFFSASLHQSYPKPNLSNLSENFIYPKRSFLLVPLRSFLLSTFLNSRRVRVSHPLLAASHFLAFFTLFGLKLCSPVSIQ